MLLEPIIASHFRSDGGNMFGPVPRGIWQRSIAADEDNTIPQVAHAMLVTLSDGTRGLVETGCGTSEKYSAKQLRFNRVGEGWPLMDALAERGIVPADIDFVIFTHLHWDHIGGAILPDGSATFPNAIHYVDLEEMVLAESGSPLLGSAYPPADIAALAALGAEENDAQLRRLLHRSLPKSAPPITEIRPGIRLLRTGGHTEFHGVLLFEGTEENPIEIAYPHAPPGTIRRVLFAADMVPTRFHLRLLFHTGYDTYPMDTRRWKQQWLPLMTRDDTLVMFGHDATAFGARLKEGVRGPEVRDLWEVGAG